MESDINYFNKKYPTSKNGHQCLGSCYKPQTWIVHPITLEHVTDLHNPFCPVKEWIKIDDETGRSEEKIIDNCQNVTAETKQSSKELEMSIIMPTMDFSCSNFLKIYYDLYSMGAVLNWLEEHSYDPYYTKKRVLDCAWKAYGFDDIVIDDRLVNFYIETVKKKWIGKLYRRLWNYIIVKNKNIFFSNKNKDKKTNDDTDKEKITKMNYIIDKFITYQNIHKIIHVYVETYKNKKEKIHSHTDNIKNELIDYVIKQVMKSLHE